MKHPGQLVALSLAYCLLSAPLSAQVATIWQVPEDPQVVDFGAANRDRQAVFVDQGMAIEVLHTFMFVGIEQVNLEAKLPEPGQFDVKLAHDQALVELKNIRTQGRRGEAEITGRIRPLSLEQAFDQAGAVIDRMIDPQARRRANQDAGKLKPPQMATWLKNNGAPVLDDDEKLRTLYIRIRALDNSASELRRALGDMARQHPRWFTTDEKQAIQKAGVAELVSGYQNLLVTEIAEKHLRDCGLALDTESLAVRDNLQRKLAAVEAIMSGRLADDQEAGRLVAEVLTAADLKQLRLALGIELKCRFFPQVDAEDANAQWFNGQRVSCRATGVATIRVEGTLDSGQKDRSDWWILERYDPAKVRLTTSQTAGVKFDPPFVGDHGALLRVVAADSGAAKYWFEFSVAGQPGDLSVLIHESPNPAKPQFPF